MTKKSIRHYHLFFVFQLHNYEKPIAFHHMSHTCEAALHSDMCNIQSLFETLQKACQNKINFRLLNKLSEHTKAADVLPDDYIYIDVIEDMTDIIQKELDSNTYEDLPVPAIARKENHLMCSICAKKDILYKIVDNKHLMSNYIHNTIFRFDRLIYIDGILTYNGCVKSEFIEPYNKRVERFLETYGDNINLNHTTQHQKIKKEKKMMPTTFDVILYERPLETGLTKTDCTNIFNSLKTDEAYPIEIENPNGTSSAMGFITTKAADAMDYDYADLEGHIKPLLTDITLGRPLGIYSYVIKKQTFDIYLSTQ